MSTHRTRIDRDAAERLLAGGTVADPGLRRVAAVLAAAAGAAGVTSAGGGAPAAPGAVGKTTYGTHTADLTADTEALPGEAAALAAFRAAHLDTVSHSRRRSVIAKLLTLKVAAGAAAVLTAGGIAAAAGSGALPNPLDHKPAAQSSAAADTPDSPRGGSATPSPSLRGLCQAYVANVGANERGKALESPAFQALIDAAGGKDKVPAYCEDLLDGRRGKSDDKKPENPAGDRPSGPPADRPSGGTTDHPTGPPTDRPGN